MITIRDVDDKPDTVVLTITLVSSRPRRRESQHGKAVEKSRQKKRGEEPTLTWEGKDAKKLPLLCAFVKKCFRGGCSLPTIPILERLGCLDPKGCLASKF